MKTDTEIIHEFMGHDWTKEQFEWRLAATIPMTIEHLNHYKTSWNWLMPVIDKITDMHNELLDNEIDDINDLEFLYVLNQTLGHNSIENVYLSIIHFIKWYNSKSDGGN